MAYVKCNRFQFTLKKVQKYFSCLLADFVPRPFASPVDLIRFSVPYTPWLYPTHENPWPTLIVSSCADVMCENHTAVAALLQR